MTRNRLVAALAKDQETTQSKIEDLLAAFYDVFAETLERGEPVRFGRIGVFRLRHNGHGLALNFYANEELRRRLNFAAPKIDPKRCEDCQRRALKAARQRKWAPKRKR